MQYEYPKITGYTWNAQQKISIALGIPMEGISISWNDINTYIETSIELTDTQKAILDTIMANNPCGIPVEPGKTVYKIPDLWSMRQWFFTKWGIEPVMWFEDGNEDGTGECYIYLHFPRALTNAEKKQIISVYGAAIKESL